MSHTNGQMRWEKRPDGSLYYVIGDHKTGSHAQGDIYIGEDDLRRLTACWNALIDLPQDALDGGWTRAGLEAYGMQMKAQRDELLAALKDLSDGFRTLKDSDFPALAKARAAIAKAEGTTP